jgi:NAD(P)-dependent dehydrogenase (short-subunit alcohol dehydrogenase family)
MTEQASGNGLFSVRGKNTLITGGTAGIGLGVAQHFVEHGAGVVITGRRDNGADIAAGIGATFVRMDVSDEESVSAAIKETAGHFAGRIDTLILNAGVDLRAGSIDALDLDAYRRLYDVNLFGLIQCLRDATSHLPRGATVIATSSPAGLLPAAGMGAYGSSKAAVNYLTRVFAAELAASGVRMNAVLPGIVESEMAGSTGTLEFIRTLTLSGKVRVPAELGGTFQFLASDASAPVTGAIIAADDGISAGLSPAAMDAIMRGLNGAG